MRIRFPTCAEVAAVEGDARIPLLFAPVWDRLAERVGRCLTEGARGFGDPVWRVAVWGADIVALPDPMLHMKFGITHGPGNARDGWWILWTRDGSPAASDRFDVPEAMGCRELAVLYPAPGPELPPPVIQDRSYLGPDWLSAPTVATAGEWCGKV